MAALRNLMRLLTEVRWKNTLVFFIRAGLGGVFVASSLPKIQQPYDFLSEVYSYGLLGPQGGYLLAFFLPWLELTTGICLLAGLFPLGSLFICSILLATFTVAKTSAVHRDLRIGCGCRIAAVGEIIGIEDVVMTGGMLTFAVLGCWLMFTSRNPDARATNSLGTSIDSQPLSDSDSSFHQDVKPGGPASTTGFRDT